MMSPVLCFNLVVAHKIWKAKCDEATKFATKFGNITLFGHKFEVGCTSKDQDGVEQEKNLVYVKGSKHKCEDILMNYDGTNNVSYNKYVASVKYK